MAAGGEYARLQRIQRQSELAPEPETETESSEPPELVSPPGQVPAAAELSLHWAADTDTLTASTLDGGAVAVVARRCFPLTEPERFICLVDPRGHELCCVEDSSALPAASQQALLSALAASELLPRVERIEAILAAATQSTWQVVTDRGARDFIVEQEDHIRRLADGRHLITDSHGMRYMIPRPEALDAKSRKLLSAFD